MAYDPAGLQLCSTSRDTTLKLWDVRPTVCAWAVGRHHTHTAALRACVRAVLLIHARSYGRGGDAGTAIGGEGGGDAGRGVGARREGLPLSPAEELELKLERGKLPTEIWLKVLGFLHSYDFLDLP